MDMEMAPEMERRLILWYYIPVSSLPPSKVSHYPLYFCFHKTHKLTLNNWYIGNLIICGSKVDSKLWLSLLKFEVSYTKPGSEFYQRLTT